MREAVSDILSARSREAEGLSRMVMVSMGAHLLLLAAVWLMPAEWRTSPRVPETTPMMISLGGSPGPDAGGMTQMAGRAVQAVAPPEPRQPFTPPPAARLPEMVLPEPTAKPAPKPPDRPVDKPAERSTARRPVTGPEVRSGAARVDTGGAAVPFGGLSTSGGGGSGARVTGLENFCCPEYIHTMEQLIRRQWNPKQGATGNVVVKFTIARDGMLSGIEVTKPSNNPLLDLESHRAIVGTRQLPPLPAQYTEQALTVHLTFEYQR